jgi:hypothetical protein
VLLLGTQGQADEAFTLNFPQTYVQSMNALSSAVNIGDAISDLSPELQQSVLQSQAFMGSILTIGARAFYAPEDTQTGDPGEETGLADFESLSQASFNKAVATLRQLEVSVLKAKLVRLCDRLDELEELLDAQLFDPANPELIKQRVENMRQILSNIAQTQGTTSPSYLTAVVALGQLTIMGFDTTPLERAKWLIEKDRLLKQKFEAELKLLDALDPNKPLNTTLIAQRASEFGSTLDALLAQADAALAELQGPLAQATAMQAAVDAAQAAVDAISDSSGDVYSFSFLQSTITTANGLGNAPPFDALISDTEGLFFAMLDPGLLQLDIDRMGQGDTSVDEEFVRRRQALQRLTNIDQMESKIRRLCQRLVTLETRRTNLLNLEADAMRTYDLAKFGIERLRLNGNLSESKMTDLERSLNQQRAAQRSATVERELHSKKLEDMRAEKFRAEIALLKLLDPTQGAGQLINGPNGPEFPPDDQRRAGDTGYVIDRIDEDAGITLDTFDRMIVRASDISESFDAVLRDLPSGGQPSAGIKLPTGTPSNGGASGGGASSTHNAAGPLRTDQ